MKKALIAGLGIGSVYKAQCEQLGYTVTSIDKNEDTERTFSTLEHFDLWKNRFPEKHQYDLGIICLPNFLHEQAINSMKDCCKTILVEKPGLKDYNTWKKYTDAGVNIVMVKNNFYRPELLDIELTGLKRIHIRWLNKNRVPRPGSWFTNKDLSWGGVEKDLMPHLIHIALATTREELQVSNLTKKQNYQLNQLDSSDYGKVDITGIYNVADYAKVELEEPKSGIKITCEAAWKTDIVDRDTFEMILDYEDGQNVIDLGPLCPDYVFGFMVRDLYTEGLGIHRSLDEFVIKVLEKFDTCGT